MRVTYNWLKEFADFEMSPTELAEKLTMVGLEVVSLEDWGKRFTRIVVGEIVEELPHPKADRLRIYGVDLGDGTVEVVSSAPNLRLGLKVPYAGPGTELPDGTEVQRTRIRGVWSEGMLCSEVELGLASEAEGVLELPEDSEPGAPFAGVAGLDDVVFELELTPNRPDCMGVLGVAREVAALTGGEVRLPDTSLVEEGKPASGSAEVVVEDPDGCPRYSARVVRGVRIGKSPLWMRARLIMAGLRPISDVVDVTNYVLLELGHPLHAFDLGKLSGSKVVVRRARKGETLETLDGVERELDREVLVIADAEKPVAIAGVMGGANSEVSPKTESLLLESAYFDPVVVRRGAKKLGISTEASRRFERGMDVEATVVALDRTAKLISDLTGGKVAPGVLDVRCAPPRKVMVSFRPDRARRLLGAGVSDGEMVRILRSLRFVVREGEGSMEVEVPSFRVDVYREVDLVEEVARIHGYDNIPENRQGIVPLEVPRRPEHLLASRTREVLTGLGMQEVITPSTVHPEFGSVKVINAPYEGASAMRTHLIPCLLEVASRNLRRRVEEVRIFEIGRVFLGGEVEEVHVGGMLTGQRRKGWSDEGRELDFYDLKGILEAFLGEVSHGAGLRFRPASHPSFEGGEASEVLLDGRPVGTCGRISEALLRRWDLRMKVYGFEVDVASLLPFWERRPQFRQLPKYPEVVRDLSFIVREDVPWEDVRRVASEADPLVESVDLFDLYCGTPIPEGYKSLAFSVSLRAPDRTLSDEEANEICSKIVRALSERVGAKLRDGRP
ncbi:MAG TPA: phenylalanine--tRNA ligase subunit beta [Candidatus Latescibacteria bacterium]|nr:phenylalanine--tRNA ligase subunit beta [Candidatus Latescibacterota bacterium]